MEIELNSAITRCEGDAGSSDDDVAGGARAPPIAASISTNYSRSTRSGIGPRRRKFGLLYPF